MHCCFQDLSHCTNSSARSLENAHKFIVFKNLQKIWEEFGPNLASENGYYDESNTLLLDDTPYKALLNPVRLIFNHDFNYFDYLGLIHHDFEYIHCLVEEHWNLSLVIQLQGFE